MNVSAAASCDVTSEDVEYRRIGDVSLLARIYRPSGSGPFPAVVGIQRLTNYTAQPNRPTTHWSLRNSSVKVGCRCRRLDSQNDALRNIR